MKKCKLIYNPAAGNKTFPKKLDRIINKLQTKGYHVDIYRSIKDDDFDESIKSIKNSDYQNILIAGGDGSLNLIINKMLEHDLNIPIGIIPAGTANDFATYLNMPTDFEQTIEIFDNKNIKAVDIAKINNKYFINVCLVGEFSSVPQDTNTEFKSLLGKMAYYLNSIKEIPNLKPIPFKIETRSTTLEEKLYMFVILNSSGAGGFKNLSPNAKINDGLFDFIGIKYKDYKDIYKLPSLLMQVLQGEHLTNKEVIHIKEEYFRIECLNSSLNNYHCDIDGETGPKLPLNISVLPQKIRIYTNRNFL